MTTTVWQHLLALCVFVALSRSANVTSCIPSTPCRCLLNERLFALLNCSLSLPDLPIFKLNSSMTITTIIARNALNRWPLHLCKYSNIHILDLSGSNFRSQSIDLTCLPQLIYLNLSRTQLNRIPNFPSASLKHLQILDLSSNQIDYLNGSLFRSLTALMTLFIQGNPLKQLDWFEQLLSLPSLEHIDLRSSTAISLIKKPLTVSQWTYLAHKWNNSNKALLIRMNTTALQSIFPRSDQFQMIPLDSMKIILRILSNSSFTMPFATPQCHCPDLRNYQRAFSFVSYEKNLSSLFQSSTCLMPNGIIHARLLDRRTLTVLNCSSLAKIAGASSKQNSCASCAPSLLIHIVTFYLLFISNKD